MIERVSRSREVRYNHQKFAKEVIFVGNLDKYYAEEERKEKQMQARLAEIERVKQAINANKIQTMILVIIQEILIAAEKSHPAVIKVKRSERRRNLLPSLYPDYKTKCFQSFVWKMSEGNTCTCLTTDGNLISYHYYPENSDGDASYSTNEIDLDSIVSGDKARLLCQEIIEGSVRFGITEAKRTVWRSALESTV